MDENKIIERAQQGDSSAFESLLTLYYDTLYRVALRWSGDRSDAEDIAQEAAIKLARNIKQYRFQSQFSTWIYRLAVNCAKDWHRSHQRHSFSPTDQTAEPRTTTDQADQSIYLNQLLQQLEQLGEGFKETVILVAGEGLSHREAATALDVQESTVSWRMHKVRKHLGETKEVQHER